MNTNFSAITKTPTIGIKNFGIVCLLLLAMAWSTDTFASRAWVWYNAPTQKSFTADKKYQYNSENGAIKGTRLGKGRYVVTIPNMGKFNTGIAQASAYGGSHSVQVERWLKSGTDLHVTVKTFDAQGKSFDGQFVLFFYKENRNSPWNSAYMWANKPNNPSQSYQYNSKGRTNKLTKLGEGRYQVVFEGITKNTAKEGAKGNILVTPYGREAVRAQIVRWVHSGNKVTATINTYDFNGTPKDAIFSISYISDFGIGQRSASESHDYGAYVWGGSPTKASYSPEGFYSANNAFRNTNKITRLGKGSYKVSLKGLRASSSSMAIASAYGSDKTYVSVDHWEVNKTISGTDVFIKCYDANGNPKDAQFSMFYYTNENILF